MILLNKNIPDPKWIEVKDLKPDDSLVYCIDDNISDIEKIDLKEFTKEKDIILDNYIEVHKGDVYPRYIDINEQFCEFLGLYVADGSSNISCDQIQITYANHEQYNEDLCTNIWNKLSGKNTTISKYIDRKARDSKMCSVLYNKAFNQWCSRKENKKLPDWCLNLPNSKTKAILKGLFVGDGHYSERQKISKYCTISKILADQIKHLLRRNRIDFNVHIDYRDDDKDKKNRQPQYLFEIPGNIISEEFKQNTRSSTHNLYYKNYHIIKIKNIKNSTYNENVYNIEVEDDNSYKSKITVLHNCEGWGMPLTDAMACGIPCMAVRYSAMEDHLICPTSVPIEVGRYFYESIIETEQRRALPNNDDFVQKLDRFVKFSYEKRQELSKQTREYAIEKTCVYGQEEKIPRFSWDRTAAIWKNILDKCEIQDINLTWLNPVPQLIEPNITQPPDGLDNVQFVNWVIENVWRRPKMINSHFAFEWMRYLNCGFMIQGTQKFNVDRQYVFNHFLNLVNNQNKAEEQRVVILNPNKSEIGFGVF